MVIHANCGGRYIKVLDGIVEYMQTVEISMYCMYIKLLQSEKLVVYMLTGYM